MGGWRCSYRNCTVRSDGKTHMFHYPVFDKVRCHQWLVNCGRLDFLNLKVSQLRNRVVCQHHFTDDNFMNFKRDKLTFDAIPTSNGPFCDNTSSDSKSIKDVTCNEYSIMLEDIENEYMTLNDKKANYSVKYGDFLSSNDLADIDISSYPSQNDALNTKKRSRNCKILEIEVPPFMENTSASNHGATEVNKHKILDKNAMRICEVYSNNNTTTNSDINYNQTVSQPDYIKKSQTPPVLVVPPYSNSMEENLISVPIEIDLPSNFFNANFLHDANDKTGINILQQTQENQLLTPLQPKSKSSVKILSEKKISEPVVVTGKLEPISTSLILPVPKNNKFTKTKETIDLTRKNYVVKNKKEICLNNTLSNPVQVEPILSSNKKENKPLIHTKSQIRRDTSPKVSLLKNRIPPERVAAIKEKRQFNMKLRDIIASFLDKLDEQDTIEKEVKVSQNVSSQSEDKVKEVESYLSKQPEISSHEYTMAFLEARMKTMEDNLLSKIDQNSQNIVDLKHALVNQPNKIKSTATQTFRNEESHKKQLYQEISKYLSPTANNLIYEELFINKYAQELPKCSSPKRKRPR